MKPADGRWAVYFLPAAGTALAALGAAWMAEHARDPRLASPRRYGFHATLKAPFRLANGCTAAALQRSARRLAAGVEAVSTPPPRVAVMGRFLVLMPDGHCAAVDRLAARLTTALDAFRAPQMRQDRRGLSARQRRNLHNWGYPWVLDDFAFHLTLAGPFAGAPDACWLAAAEAHFAPLRQGPVLIDAVSLCHQRDGAEFREVARLPIRPPSAPPSRPSSPARCRDRECCAPARA